MVGIRPESWKVTADAKGPAVATVVEHLGPQTALVLDVEGMFLRVSVSPTLRVKSGDRFRLGMDPGDLVYMDR
jgi:ABC-type sugar transport system ATPase subunit